MSSDDQATTEDGCSELDPIAKFFDRAPAVIEDQEEAKRLEEENYYQRRAEREHREELRGICLIAASRVFSGAGNHAGGEAVLRTAKQFYNEWVKESE